MTETAASLGQTIAGIEASARIANSVAELSFAIANDAYPLLAFQQALVFADNDAAGELLAVSGLARPTEDSPYLVWLRSAWPWLRQRFETVPGWFVASADLPDTIAEGWREWWPTGVLALPLRRRSGEGLGWVCFLLDAAPDATVEAALRRVAQTWSYCWEMLGGRPQQTWRMRWRQLPPKRRRMFAAAICALLLLPVRQTALAPAEVVALDAEVVAAPLDGVIKTVHVRPNQPVKLGQPLFSLDETTLRNRLEVARKSVAVADAELLSMTQRAFDSSQSKSDLAMLAGRAQERRAELAAVQAQLTRIDVPAPRDGIAVFADQNDWIGRPVSTGERIMLLADPSHPGVLIHLPVADAVSLEPGAAVKLFLTVMPLSPLSAQLIETSYQATPSPEGIASYRLRAAFDPGHADEAVRIGLRGTAKIYGRWVVFGYFILRRPLATLREWSGW